MSNYNYYSLRRLFDIDNDYIKTMLDIKDIIGVEKYCIEAEACIKEIRDLLAEQVKRMQEIEEEKYIIVDRRKSYYNNIEVTVRVQLSRKLGDYKRTSDVDNTYKLFTGKEKKQALEYAEELRKKYSLRIIKNNWK